MVFISLKKILRERPPSLFGDNADENAVMACGLDEAGRGPWAGPVVACALIFKKENPPLRGVKDSKKLTAVQRESLYKKIQSCAWIGVGKADASEIDESGILKATKKAYERALAKLEKHMTAGSCAPGKDNLHLHLIIDGRDKFNLPYPATSIIKGDQKVKIVACASIIAKVERDRMMRRIHRLYPRYGFGRHKGYGTAAHIMALKKYGVCPLHRNTYKPVAEIIRSQQKTGPGKKSPKPVSISQTISLQPR